MARAAFIIYAGTETGADRGRLLNGLEAAREFSESLNHTGEVIFDGAGTRWVPRLEDPDHEFHDLYRSIEDIAHCEYCADAFGVTPEVEEAGVTVYGGHDGHPSFASLLSDEYEVITF